MKNLLISFLLFTSFSATAQENSSLELQKQISIQRNSDLEKFSKLNEENKNKSIAESEQELNQGHSAFKNKQFQTALINYQKALSINPMNEVALYSQGLTYYQIGQYQKAISILQLSETSDEINKNEKQYYIASSYAYLKNYQKALKDFKDIVDENDSQFSPLASFAAGQIELQNKNWQAARPHFQYILDFSKDPILDKKAEEMLEYIDNQENFEAAQKDIHHFSFFIGPQNDSNVLNISTASVATSINAFRLQYGGNYSYDIIKKQNSLLGFNFYLNDYYSTKTNFASDSTIQSADALEYSLSLPWQTPSWKITPLTKFLVMAPQGGARKTIMTTNALQTVYNWNYSKEFKTAWSAYFGTQYSQLTVSSSDDDQTGYDANIAFSGTKNFSKNYSLVTDLSYEKTRTNGVTYRLSKPLLGLSFNFPGYKKETATTRLEYSTQYYSEASTPHQDGLMNIYLIQNMQISPKWNFTVTLEYSKSQSNQSTYNYEKYLIGTLFNWTI